MNSIFIRRSIRQFKSKHVEEDKLERLLRAAMQAPSANNRQPWEFIVVRDKKTREEISKMSPYAGMCTAAPVLIVTLADTTAYDSVLAKWNQDMSAATQNILLQAVEEGLGAVWLGFYPDEERCGSIRVLFNLPKHIAPFSVIAIGYGETENTFVDRFRPDRIHYEKW